MSPNHLQDRIAVITEAIAGRTLDAQLASWLNERFPADGPAVRDITAACHAGVAQGWLCQHEHGGIRYGRAIEAHAATHGFSVDVVDMNDVAGPHHVHPHGEVDLIMPLDAAARFDGHPAGWCVYGPASSHRPTVSGGRALVLYLLPDGAIEFTRRTGLAARQADASAS
ncbi:DUF4863 family protein [Chitinasiproducens palmae]|uniref:DUF4863 family protein n=1 Tax=Chitinasiproducens palmae TaxID=1770053 RepID=A0A1H2PS16_9BURK|nr:DUF4863 family protein [Chitinasiproducens palmae]SDV49731.1 protein of unknown function [Chitinasiproducens palmae]